MFRFSSLRHFWIESIQPFYVTASSRIIPIPNGFKAEEVSDRNLRHFIQQFSVFSNEFLVAALLKVINAPSLEQSRSSREILLKGIRGNLSSTPSTEAVSPMP